LNHDIEDARRAGLLREQDLPAEARSTLGGSHSERIGTLVTDCVVSSQAAAGGDGGRIALSARVLAATDVLREFMFERVYLVEATLGDARRGQRIVAALYNHYRAHPEQIEGWSLPGDPPWRRAADWVSGMTDGFALRRAQALGLVE
jgi:dGTPase